MSSIQANIQISKINQTNYSSDYKIFKTPLKQPICVISPVYGNVSLLESLITKVKTICQTEVPDQKEPYFVSAGGCVKNYDTLAAMYKHRVNGDIIYNLLSMDEFILCNYLHLKDDWKNPDFLKRWLAVFGLHFHKSCCEHYQREDLLSEVLTHAQKIKQIVENVTSEDEVIEELVKTPDIYYKLFEEVRNLIVNDPDLKDIESYYNFAGNNQDRAHLSWVFSPVFKFGENVVIVPSFYEFKLAPGAQNLLDLMTHEPIDPKFHNDITHAFNFHCEQPNNDFCFGAKGLFKVDDVDFSKNINVNTLINENKNKYTAVLFINDSVRFIQIGVE